MAYPHESSIHCGYLEDKRPDDGVKICLKFSALVECICKQG